MRPEGPRSITINYAPMIHYVDRAPLGRTNFLAGRLPSPLGWAEGFRAVGPNTNRDGPLGRFFNRIHRLAREENLKVGLLSRPVLAMDCQPPIEDPPELDSACKIILGM